MQQLSPIAENCNSHQEPEDDTISVYVFGEEELELENEARKHGGYLQYEQLACQFGTATIQNVRQRLPSSSVLLFDLRACELTDKPTKIVSDFLICQHSVVIVFTRRTISAVARSILCFRR